MGYRLKREQQDFSGIIPGVPCFFQRLTGLGSIYIWMAEMASLALSQWPNSGFHHAIQVDSDLAGVHSDLN